MPNTTTMTVARAMNELKLLDKKIHKGIREGCFVSFKIGNDGDSIIPGCEPTSSFQSITSLIQRRNRIKSAILISNATTTVKIGSREMTVAEAIDKKKSIQYEKELLMQMKRQSGDIHERINYEKDRAEERFDKIMRETAGKEGKVREEDIRTSREVFMANNKPTIIDPLNIDEKIQELDEFIDTFENEVDISLNESNARTTITIEDD